ncbi:MAG: hypothetical protein IT204_07995 [Fimbriimonadaceae bacterium]|nr:hypothetical protein [Fimbriimonadaceae bacterium]
MVRHPDLAANALALARGGRTESVRSHWAAVSARPFTWTNSDSTPALEIAALAWLHQLGATP